MVQRNGRVEKRVADPAVGEQSFKRGAVLAGIAERMLEAVRKGQMKHCKAAGRIGEGEGQRMGTAYWLKDGTVIYAPEDDAQTLGSRPEP